MSAENPFNKLTRYLHRIGSWDRFQNLGDQERRLMPYSTTTLAMRTYGSASPDFLSHVTHLPLEIIRGVIADLEILGIVTKVAGNTFNLVDQ